MNGSKITLDWVILPEKYCGARRAALAAVFVSSKKTKKLVKSMVTED